jgi:hypothetical protein
VRAPSPTAYFHGQLPAQQPRVAKHRNGRAIVGLHAAAAAPGRGSSVAAAGYPSTMVVPCLATDGPQLAESAVLCPLLCVRDEEEEGSQA